MTSSIPNAIQPLLNDYLRLMDENAPGLLVAFYLHGSVALGAFNPQMSDIDFLTVLRHRCSAEEIAGLQTVHATLAAQYPQWPMEGIYLQWSELGQFDDTVLPYPRYADGVLEPMNNNSLNAVIWWMLKHKGIAVVGPPVRELDFAVDETGLLKDMAESLNTYWKNFTYKPQRMAWFLSDYGVQWVVLGVLRQWHTFRERDITSKVAAGHYALEHLPPKWHRIVREAIRIREGGKEKLYRSRITRGLDALNFLKYVIRECNTVAIPATLHPSNR